MNVKGTRYLRDAISRNSACETQRFDMGRTIEKLDSIHGSSWNFGFIGTEI